MSPWDTVWGELVPPSVFGVLLQLKKVDVDLASGGGGTLMLPSNVNELCPGHQYDISELSGYCVKCEKREIKISSTTVHMSTV